MIPGLHGNRLVELHTSLSFPHPPTSLIPLFLSSSALCLFGCRFHTSAGQRESPTPSPGLLVSAPPLTSRPELCGLKLLMWRNWQDERVKGGCLSAFNDNQVPAELEDSSQMKPQPPPSPSPAEGLWPRPLLDIISIISGSV